MPKAPSQRRVVPFDLRLRRAVRRDTTFTEALYLRTMLPLLAALGLGDDATLRARFAKAYKPDCSKIVVIEAVDMGWIQLSRTSAGHHLDQLHLVPEWCGRGIGSFLLDRLLQRAGRAGSTVALDVIRGNPAVALYTRLGFLVVGEDEEKYKMLWQPVKTTR